MELEVIKNTVKPFCSVDHKEIDGIKIAEVYWHEGDSLKLDFVLMFFGYNKQNQRRVSELIEEYHVKKADCIIGCNDFAGEVIDFTDNDEYKVFSNLMKQFDLHLDSASSVDFENLVDVCMGVRESICHFTMNDFKSEPGTEIHLVTEESSSISELKGLVSEACRKLVSHRESKFPKVLISFSTIGHELLMDEINEIIDSFDGFSKCDEIMTPFINEAPGQGEELIKVNLIFYEG